MNAKGGKGQVPQPRERAPIAAEGGSEGVLIWANLLHLGCNMWADCLVAGHERDYICYQPHLRCDTELWNELVQAMAAAGLNMAVIDLADGVHYASHPEIAVRGAWSTARLRRELVRLRRLGIEPTPSSTSPLATTPGWARTHAACPPTRTTRCAVS